MHTPRNFFQGVEVSSAHPGISFSGGTLGPKWDSGLVPEADQSALEVAPIRNLWAIEKSAMKSLPAPE